MPDDAQLALDYLGYENPLNVGARPALPTGGAAIGSPASPSVPAPAGGVAGAGAGPAAASRNLRAPRSSSGPSDAIRALSSGVQAARFGSNVGEAINSIRPLSVPSGDIQEGVQTAPYGPSRGFSVPPPTYGGEGVGELSGALETSIPMGADVAEKGLSELASGALSTVGDVLPFVGPTIGMIPQWVQGQGGPPFGDSQEGAAAALASMMAASAATGNPAALFGTVGAGLISGLLETAGVVGKSDYDRARENDAWAIHGFMPQIMESIFSASSPEELAGRFRAGFADPGETQNRWHFDFLPDFSDVAMGGLRAKQGDIEQINQQLERAAQAQMSIMNAAKAGVPEALALMSQGQQRYQGSLEGRRRKAEEDQRLAELARFESQTMNTGSE